MINTTLAPLTDALLDQAKQHLEGVLGSSPSFTPFTEGGRLPVYFTAAYGLYRTTLMGIPCLAMLDKREGLWTPAVVAKQAQVLGQLTNLGPVFIAKACALQQRQRLIAQRVAFVIPGSQVFLPPLGMDLRQRVRQVHGVVEKFSPATQVLVLRALISRETEFSPSKTAVQLGYSAMTLTRAFNELETSGLARCRQQGRQRILEFSAVGTALWDKAKLLLPSPVKHRGWVHDTSGLKGSVAGLPALAEWTNLAPQGSALAVNRGHWKAWLAVHPGTVFLREDPGATEVQVWRYPPETFAKAGKVDPFSLYLSLMLGQDERVEQALEQLEKQLW